MSRVLMSSFYHDDSKYENCINLIFSAMCTDDIFDVKSFIKINSQDDDKDIVICRGIKEKPIPALYCLDKVQDGFIG